MGVAPAVDLDARLQPPPDLTAYEVQVWQSVVATKPSNWFQADCAPILKSYVKHISTAATFDQQLETFNPEKATKEDWTEYLRLTEARRKQTQIITTCATKLRLTPQSKYDEKTAFVAAKAAGNTNARGKTKLWDQD